MQDNIVIRGARQHNLKNINIVIPRNKFVVLTGLSGSGKSSLAFDTLYAEGQRRYVESLSSYARQFLGQMDKPDVDSIEGLSPAISIDQKTTSRNPRSTVGTVTEIHDYLRLLFANIGVPHCPNCGKPIKPQSVDQIIDRILLLPQGSKVLILAPIIRGRKGEYQKMFDGLQKDGFVRVRVDGVMYELGQDIKLTKTQKHTIEVVVDRLVIKPDIQQRLTDSVETALRLADGLVTVSVVDGEEKIYSQNYSCIDCDVSIPELSPRLFTFNNPLGACPACTGIGTQYKIDPALIVPNPELSLAEGAINASGWTTDDEGSIAQSFFQAISEKYGFSMDTPFRDIPEKAKDEIFYGSGKEKLHVTFGKGDNAHARNIVFEGIINNLERRYHQTSSWGVKYELEQLMTTIPCPVCKGKRLKPEVLSVTIADKSIADFSDFSIRDALDFINTLELSEKERIISAEVIKEIKERLTFLINVGLDYLTLSRAAGTLSGGEAQRIRLATQIGSGLMGVMYILDEPSIGLHQRDNSKLLNTLKRLRDLGNTLIVVEHDAETMLESDYVIDIGPGAGVHGGNIIAEGTPAEIMADPNSITGAYLSGRKTIAIPEQRRHGDGRFLKILGAKQNNLKNIDVAIPLGTITCVTGVSGSGKSSLINEILAKALMREVNRAKVYPGLHDAIEGIEEIDKVILINQSPIGRTPRSNPATYTGLFDSIRALYAMTNEAKGKGYSLGRFSFNVKGGRCEACKGDGIIKIEMHFLPDVYVPCEVCKGARYNRETLQVRYKGKNIAEVLDMTVEDALEFFSAHTQLRAKLQTLYDVGLGYIKLGQPSTTLSGGEAQRIKLATELSRKSTGRTVYILDEPTTGLHIADVERLIGIMHRLVEGGNTVIVIEHNLDVIKISDYIIDLGPEGGDRGGQIVCCGTPEEVAQCESSYTGHYLEYALHPEWEE